MCASSLLLLSAASPTTFSTFVLVSKALNQSSQVNVVTHLIFFDAKQNMKWIWCLCSYVFVFVCVCMLWMSKRVRAYFFFTHNTSTHMLYGILFSEQNRLNIMTLVLFLPTHIFLPPFGPKGNFVYGQKGDVNDLEHVFINSSNDKNNNDNE